MFTFGGLTKAGKIWVDVVHRCFPEGGNFISKSLLLGVLASEAERFVYLLAMP